MTDKVAFITERMNDQSIKQAFPNAEARRAHCEELWAQASGDEMPDVVNAEPDPIEEEVEVAPEPEPEPEVEEVTDDAEEEEPEEE